MELPKQDKAKILTELSQTGLIDSITLPFVIPSQNDNAVFCITKKGAQILALKQEKPIESFKYPTSSSRKRSLLFLEHTICLNELILCLENLKSDELELLQIEKEPERFNLKVFVKSDKGRVEKIPLIPDAFFRIKHKEKIYVFFAEIDRGTVNLGRMETRFRAYLILWRQRFAEIMLGSRNFRLLVITISEKRLKNLLNKVNQLEAGQGIFWFTTQDKITLETPENILEHIWTTTKAQTQALFE